MNSDPVPPSPSFVEAVCYRPRMYTANGTLEEVCCFLNGFYSGMTAHTRNQQLIAHANRDWYRFLEFVNSPRQGEPNSDWFVLYTNRTYAVGRTCGIITR